MEDMNDCARPKPQQARIRGGSEQSDSHAAADDLRDLASKWITARRIGHYAFLVAGLMAMLCLGLAKSARADEGPAHFVRDLGRKAIDVLSDNGQNALDRERVFRSLLIEHFDIKKIGRLVMGRHWRTASDPQKAEFSDLFEDFIVATYARRLSEYSDQKFIVGASRQNSKHITAVSSRITSPDGASVGVDWMLQHKADRWYVVDVVIEGISMVITQRAEFGTVISQRGGIDGLLEALHRKVETAASGQT